ncbi:cation diffusion facilitator family transporter [Geminicoccaceae bacterium 1502E]|nr:cation diffusion facilitator family transporter [Geminicoccaceae bacterium 1502E]
MASGNKKVVYAALVGNALIAVTKFVAAAWTGSSAMLSEGIHSLVDTGNQGLLLYGMRRAARPADREHPFGHAQELYFWAFVVAILIFALGGGISIYEGIAKIREPHAVEAVHVSYIVLGLAFLFEAAALWAAWRAFQRTRRGRGMMEALRGSKDPAIFTVLVEDAAALMGLVIAFIGIFLGQLLDEPRLDGVASVAIGCLLVATAVFLARETRSLLTGEAASNEVIAGLREVMNEHPGITGSREVMTMHLGPEEVLVAANLGFAPSLDAGEVEETVAGLERRIREAFPQVRHLFIEAQALRRHRPGAADANGPR